MIYPVTREPDSPEEELGYEDFAADWSENWVVEVDPDVESDMDVIRIGPLAPRAAWDLANELEALRQDWTFRIVPIFEPDAPAEIVASIESLDD
jgi:hypothetical protein